MNELVTLIKRIGIFMIAAQAVLHFAPGQKYEKYIKLIISILILLQFVTPLAGIISRTETDWSGKLAEMEALFGEEGLTGENKTVSTAADVMVESLENEIKSRLNDEISGEGYVVSNVQVRLRPIEEGSSKQYELEKVRVVVYGDVSGTQTDNAAVGKIQIDKIDVSLHEEEWQEDSSKGGEEGQEGGEARLFQGEEEKSAQRLRARFARVLGLEEEMMEVSVYGANEKTDR